jgi:single-stranded DNA-specific DHH superfamily exonuclease
MLTKKQLLEIRSHLEKSQNPVFFYDNDVDGICSYIILRRFGDKGKGVAVKSHPDIDQKYAKKAQELGADYVFVLDRPELGVEFVDEIKNIDLPIVWIDHHAADEGNYDYENLWIYNPTKNKDKSDEATTYLCYKATERREDLWIALMGCLADRYFPEFVDEFEKEYPEYWSKDTKKAYDGYYKSGIGRLARALSFAIKDSISHVVQLQNFLINCRTPRDFDLELEGNKSFGRKYREILKKYQILLDKAKRLSGEEILFFNYGGDMSISSDISNELCYLYPDKVVAVAYTAGPFTNISLRGTGVKKILEEILPLMDGATGGGHDNAVGSRIGTKDLERFKEELYKRIDGS